MALVNWKDSFAIVWRGALMGIADVVPGVSGGTVALLVGIYPRLIAAIAAIDLKTFHLLLQRQWSAVAQRTDLTFLISLGIGIVSGLLVTLQTVAKLLAIDSTRSLVLAAFLGMLIAASIVLWKRLREEFQTFSGTQWVCAIVGLGLALVVSFSQQVGPAESPSYWFIFLCGSLGICAMILPGISGAMVLLLLGVYQFLVHIPSELLHRNEVSMNLTYLVVFGLGCVTGLLTIARFLKWILTKSPANVMLFLWGLMLGALPILWPYQVNTTPDQEKLSLRRYAMITPDFAQASQWLPVVVAVVCLLAVLWLDRWADKYNQNLSGTLSAETSV